jgi:hypothetical protein
MGQRRLVRMALNCPTASLSSPASESSRWARVVAYAYTSRNPVGQSHYMSPPPMNMCFAVFLMFRAFCDSRQRFSLIPLHELKMRRRETLNDLLLQVTRKRH